MTDGAQDNSTGRDSSVTAAGGGTFPVVGIGTSAGGIEALQSFFKAVPAKPGMAFVVIQHLQRDRKSHLAEILSRWTDMPVAEVTAAVQIKPDHVYVIPPDKVLELTGETLCLSGLPEERLLRKPVDAFFRSLAEACGPRAVAIVMSGTGGNGSMGVRDIKIAGGIVLVQDPLEAKYDNMPRHTIATGTVDQILPVEQMPGVLEGYARHPYLRQVESGDGEQKPDDQQWKHLENILALLRARTGRELRAYKKNTLLRRTMRRMGLRHITDFEEYLQVLRNDPNEANALAEDLLIGVTSFLRDPEAWQTLEKEVLEKLVSDSEPDQAIRVWVPGCSSGEEAYSVAMLLHEQARKAKHRGEIKVFATDMAGLRLQQAREGRFPDSIEADLPGELLVRYFEKRDESYKIRQSVRESVIFASHNLIQDPPFSQLDLISCRNLLIYLEPEAQARVLALLHFSLRPGGYLFLGTSETTSQQPDLFQPVSKKWRIFRRLGPTRHELVNFPVYGRSVPKRDLQHYRGGGVDTKSRLDRLVHRTLSTAYAPAAVLVTRSMEALYFHGPTDRYLTQPAGERTASVLEMAREGLRFKLRQVVLQAFENKRRVVDTSARVRRDGAWVATRLTGMPLHGGADEFVLVVFEDADASGTQQQQEPTKAKPLAPGSDAVQTLEDELRNTRLELESTIEDLENANEEQKATNEELSSMNEEFQSTNEELETSKEELQSLNEELTTVNQQLHTKVDQLESANNDLQNLLASTDVATIFLDGDFHLRWFSPSVRDLLSVVASDVGRPLTDFVRKFEDPHLFEDAKRVMEKLVPISREIRTDDGRWCIRRVLPYRTQDDRIEGTVVTFTDITELKQAEERERRLATVVRDSNDAVIVLDFQGNIREWNRGATAMYGWSEAEADAMNVRDIVPPEYQDEVEAMLGRLGEGREIGSRDMHRVCEDGRKLIVSSTVSVLRDERDQPTAIAVTERDVTELRDTQRKLEAFNAELERRVTERTALAERRAAQLHKLSLDLYQAEEQERRRIAGVLHDDLQQILAAARMAFNRLRLAGGRTGEEIDSDVQHLDALFEQAMQTTRNLSHELSPPVLQEGLVPALHWAQRWYAKNHDLEIDLEVDPEAEPANAKLRYPLFCACRELLFNVVKHAGTNRATLGVVREGTLIRLTVSDSGKGFDPASVTVVEDGRLGLFTIRERIRSVGGEMRIESEIGRGSEIQVTVPDVDGG
ncbi:MAG: CheR family methyltransferase [Phycisphaeraceae bacterium]